LLILLVGATPDLAQEIRGIAEELQWRLAVEPNISFATARKTASADVLIVCTEVNPEVPYSQFFEQIDESIELLLVCENSEDEERLVSIRSGASYIFQKPIEHHFLNEVLVEIAKEIEAERHAEDATLERPSLLQFGMLYGSSRPMRKLYRKMRKVSATDSSVMLIGESGVGKELVTKTLHQLSPRRESPFLAINCSAISGELLESELFGHVKGSFTGATQDHNGFFERAKGGTLFLDEITEMDPQLQTKLLRVLESNTFFKVGGEEEQVADCRIIAATNRDPMEATRQGLFRKDLFFRLAQFPLNIPPLRVRGEDIVDLARLFLEQHNQENNTAKFFSEEVTQILREYPWPGNVRELRHGVEHAYIMSHLEIERKDLPPQILKPDSLEQDSDTITIPTNTTLDEVEQRMIETTLERLEGDKQQTADTLGISLKTLYNKLKKYESVD
jgi:DNA-binding NtrC family response regulator